MGLRVTRREIASIAKMTIPAAFFLVLYIVFEEAIQNLDPISQLAVLLVLGGMTAILYRRTIRRFLF